MPITIHRVAAFADDTYAGNPAGVCELDGAWPSDATLTRIAARVGLSETAFVTRDADGAKAIRWFTPRAEVPLCGHATLGAARVILDRDGASRVVFRTREAGPLAVERDHDRFTMDFPANPPTRASRDADLEAALGARPRALFRGFKILARFDDATAVSALRPDFARLAALAPSGLIATAPGDEEDFVSRYFAPHVGVDEDPVTGSAHTVLAPYWAEALDRTQLVGRQIPAAAPPSGGLAWTDTDASAGRPGGVVRCEARGDRVLLGGTTRRTGTATLD